MTDCSICVLQSVSAPHVCQKARIPKGFYDAATSFRINLKKKLDISQRPNNSSLTPFVPVIPAPRRFPIKDYIRFYNNGRFQERLGGLASMKLRALLPASI